MGNSASSAAISNSDLASDMQQHIKFLFAEEMRGCRYIKTSRCLQNEATHVVKAVAKSSASPEVIERYKAEVERMHKIIHEQSVCRVIPLRLVGDSARAVYACRPYVYTDLRRRITSRPFLVQQERLLIVYGVLLAVEQLHTAGIVHGDIKSSNVLLTSTNLVLLSDVTPWKPVQLPTDNTAQLSYYFESDIDVRCSVAPERFYDAAAGASPAVLAPAMDIFSLGCLIFELLTDKPLFGLPELRQHAEGKFNLDAALARPALQPVASIVKKCVALNPAQRLNIWEITDIFRSLVPQSQAFESFIEPTLRTSATMMARDRLLKLVMDRKMWLEPECRCLIVHAVNIVIASSSSADASARALVADALTWLAPCCDNDILLQRVIPCCVQQMADAAGRSQFKFINALLLACKCVTALPPADSEIMPLYILPAFSKAASVHDAFECSSVVDAAVARQKDTALPQMHVAMRIHEIAAESLRFLELSARSVAYAWASPTEATAPAAAAAGGGGGKSEMETYELRVARVRDDIVTILKGLLKAAFVGTQVALLNNVVPLGSILGRKLFKDVLLPYLVSMLNFSPCYLVRVAFFNAMSNMALVVGGRTVKQIYLPLYERQLATAHNEVELEVTLKGLLRQADAGLALREMLLPLVKCAAPFMLHYSPGVRVLAISFVAAVAAKLGEVETRVLLLPSIRRFFTKDPILVTFDSCTSPTSASSTGCLKPPITFEAFDFAAAHFNEFLVYCRDKNPDFCKHEQPLLSEHKEHPSPAHGVGSKPQPKPPILWNSVMKDDNQLFGCAHLVGNIKSLAVSNLRRHEVMQVLEDIVGDEWLQEEWNASFWNTSDEQYAGDPALVPSAAAVASADRNLFLARSSSSRVRAALRPSPFIDGIVLGSLATLNARVVALLPSPDCSWLIAVSASGDVLAYDCTSLLDEAFVAPFTLPLLCEVHAASAVLLSNASPCVGVVAVGGDKGIVHIISIESVRPDYTARSRSIFAGASSRRSEIVSYRLAIACTVSMECDSGRIMSVCAFAPALQPSASRAAAPAVGGDVWRLLSYCTSKSYIAHWIMHGGAAPSKPPRRIELDRSLGGVQSMAVSPCGLWAAAGTSRGCICICDLRFSVLIKTIFTCNDTMLSSIIICPAPPVSVDPSDVAAASAGVRKGWFSGRSSSQFGPQSPPGIPMESSRGGSIGSGDASAPRMWVVVPSGGGGGDAVSAHNVATGECEAKFEISRGSPGSGDGLSGSLSGISSSTSAKACSGDDLVKDRYATRLLQSRSALPVVRAITIATNTSGGDAAGHPGAAVGMFTAGSDRHLRYWSFAHPEQCSCTLLPPLAAPNQAQTEIFAHRSEDGCAVFSAQPLADVDHKGDASSVQQKYRKGLDALAQSSVGELVGVSALCMIGSCDSAARRLVVGDLHGAVRVLR